MNTKMRVRTTMGVALAGLAAVLGLLVSPAGAQVATSGPGTSGGALASNDSVASGCSTAIDDSTASGADCVPLRVVTTVPPGTPGGGGAATTGGGAATTAAARAATTAQLARTGSDLDGLAAAAGLSTALGGVFLALGRRRKPTALHA